MNQTNKKEIQGLERTLTTAPSHSSHKGNQPITSTFDNSTVTITRGTGRYPKQPAPSNAINQADQFAQAIKTFLQELNPKP